MKDFIVNFLKDEEGLTMVEYAIAGAWWPPWRRCIHDLGSECFISDQLTRGRRGHLSYVSSGRPETAGQRTKVRTLPATLQIVKR